MYHALALYILARHHFQLLCFYRCPYLSFIIASTHLDTTLDTGNSTDNAKEHGELSLIILFFIIHTAAGRLATLSTLVLAQLAQQQLAAKSRTLLRSAVHYLFHQRH